MNVNRNQIVDHDPTGKAMRHYARKNKKIVTLPMRQELRDVLAELKVQRADGMITVRDDGTLARRRCGPERAIGVHADRHRRVEVANAQLNGQHGRRTAIA